MTLVLTTGSEGLPTMEGHGVAAHIRCERCGETLHPEAGGRVAWEPDESERYLDVAFLHESCVEGYDRDAGTEPEVRELRPFLAALIHNLEEAG